MIIRRYLKLVYNYCSENNMLDKQIEEIVGVFVPFKASVVFSGINSPSNISFTNAMLYY